MRLLQDIYHKRARKVFVFNNFYDEKVMKGFDDIKEKAREIVDMVYDLHVKNNSLFNFYGYRMDHEGKTYDIYINFGSDSLLSNTKEGPWMFPLDIEAARQQKLQIV